MKPLGLPFAARVALMIASDVLGKKPRHLCKRDPNRVRGLACLMLRGADVPWPDITLHLYGHRTGHSSSISAAKRWRGTELGALAVRKFLSLWEADPAKCAEVEV